MYRKFKGIYCRFFPLIKRNDMRIIGEYKILKNEISINHLILGLDIIMLSLSEII
jgi:hypothetical protein